MCTISNAHKAHVILKNKEGIHLNTDGTTKHQRKLGGVIANNVVVSVNELPDGKAVSIISDISREFEKIRKVGVPEYTCGVISLPDFLQLQVDATKDEELKSYYQACQSITLHRQVGSSTVFDQGYSVFYSEKRIYSSDVNLNHHLQSKIVYQKLFDNSNSAESLLNTLLVKGASKMKEKLSTYAADQLPGGCYYEPKEEVRSILCEIKPSNDACESVLGLNDYLTTAIPNLHQLARFNMIQMKKNKHLNGFQLSQGMREASIIDLAVKQKRLVSQEYRDSEKTRAQQRQHKMQMENAESSIGKEIA
uniref:Uncharacterized protein n=1 Tax=Amphimedon queenslandica TaxID=400682 RepID=A0A1X7UU70_AMPQE